MSGTQVDEKATYLNAVKIWFSVLARKLLKAGNFTRASGKSLSCFASWFCEQLNLLDLLTNLYDSKTSTVRQFSANHGKSVPVFDHG